MKSVRKAINVNSSVIIALLIIGILLTGCATTDKFTGKSMMDHSKLEFIKNNETNKQEVIELFGNPTSLELTSDAKEIIIYRYPKPRYSTIMMTMTGDMTADYDTLQFLIDQNGIVEKYVLHEETPIQGQ